MASTVKLSQELIDAARTVSKTFNRSIAGQIEHWAKMGKLVEENPDITYDFIKDIIISMSEDEAGKRVPYEVGID